MGILQYLFIVCGLLVAVLKTETTNKPSLGKLQWNRYKPGPYIRQIWNISLKDCAEECARRSQCVSINYRRRFLQCDLNDGSSVETEDTNEYVYSQIMSSDFPCGELGECLQNNCPNGTRCSSLYGEVTCHQTECASPPQAVSNADVTYKSHQIREIANYNCKEGFLPTGNVTTSICLSNGLWSATDLFCQRQCPRDLNYSLLPDPTRTCYKFFTKSLNYFDSSALCKRDGGHLFTLTENKYSPLIFAWNDKYSTTLSFRVDGHLINKIWSAWDGSVLTFLPWAYFEPTGTLDMTSLMIQRLKQFKMDDIPEYYAEPFLCEIDTN